MVITARTRRRLLLGRIKALALLCLFTVSAGGNDNNQDNNSSNNNNKGYHDVQAFCKRHYVQVTGLWLTCDTPGAYYYGGTAYRNSEVCMSGDKANLRVEFIIPSSWDSQAISLEIQSGMYNHFETVITSSSICQTLSISSTYEGGAECPNPGYFTLSTYYTVPSIRDYAFHYTPDIKLIFTDPRTGQRIGCATTGTVAMHRRNDIKARHGLVALGLSIITFCFVFGLLLFLSYKRKKRLEELREKKQQNYHYFKTLPSGQVVPMPGVSSKLATVRESGPPLTSIEADAMNISNPAYNETQIPTRPII